MFEGVRVVGVTRYLHLHFIKKLIVESLPGNITLYRIELIVTVLYTNVGKIQILIFMDKYVLL